jgi:hypothetical protein
MTNFQLGTSGGAMGIELSADLCTPSKISKPFKIIRTDVLQVGVYKSLIRSSLVCKLDT